MRIDLVCPPPRPVLSLALKWVRSAVVVGLALTSVMAGAQTISVSAAVAGKTPRVIGLNSGSYLPGSNATTWWKYSKVNGARLFTSAPRIEPQDDLAPHGDGVSSESSFLVRRSALRGDPLNTSYINWPYFENNYATNESDLINYEHAYGELSSNGVKPLAMINRTAGQYPFDTAGSAAGWADRWEHWQHYYAQAFYLGSNFDVERYSMYNEPDHSSQSVTQADYLERLQLASDAIQSALADVNSLYGKQLEPQVLAPITAGASKDYLPRLDNSDPRDDVTGWGELVIQNLHTNFLGQVDPDFQLVHTYAYQEYNHDGPRYAQELSTIKQYVNADAPGADLGFGLTEFNVHSNGVFEGLSETLDSPSKYSRLGGILSSLANEQPDELYLFKFSPKAQADPEDFQKNGIHYVSNDDAPHNVGGVSHAGAAFRLFNAAFVGGQTLHAAPSHNVNDLYVSTSHNPEKDYYYWFSANESTTTRSLQVDLSAWGVEPGAVVQVEEVREGSLAEITQRITVPGNQTISVSQDGQSVLLLSVPRTTPGDVLTIAPTDDAMVKAANNAHKNYGGSDNLTVKNVADSPNGRNASLIKFDTTGIGDSEIERAVLQLYGENLGSDAYATAHVYGVLDDDWSELSVTWDSTANLADTQGVAVGIRDNFIEGVNDTAEFVGHLTVGQSFGRVAVDVTDFLLEHPDQQVTFLIAREVRFDGENFDETASHLRFASKDRAGGFGPRLILELRDAALPGDFNGDGAVDAADYTVWRDSYQVAQSGLPADANGDGVVDNADYDIWAANYGATQGATSVALPEPAALLGALLACSASFMKRRQAQVW